MPTIISKKLGIYYFLLSILFFVFGIGLSGYINNNLLKQKFEPGTNSLQETIVFHQEKEANVFSIQKVLSDFFNIFVTNLINMVLIIVGGLVTSGVITSAFLLWNGFALFNIIFSAINSGLNIEILLKSILFHGPIELIAIIWAGAIGFRGISIAISFVNDGIKTFTTIGNYITKQEIITLVGLFTFAAIIEALIINIL